MPEGDTILQAARRLEHALAGQPIVAVDTNKPRLRPGLQSLVGREVAAVSAKGKYLFVEFGREHVLVTHLKMSGSWRVYAPGQRWHKPRRQASVVLEGTQAIAVCFNAPVAEIVSASQATSWKNELGPDLLDENFDVHDAVARMRRRPELPIGVALMTQRLVAGIGNVYKSEVLFGCRVDPFGRVAALDDAQLERLLLEARQQLRRNLGTKLSSGQIFIPPRRTRVGLGRLRYNVYSRSGQPCLVCGTRIEMRRQGDQGRSTYYCASCQGVRPNPPQADSRLGTEL